MLKMEAIAERVLEGLLSLAIEEFKLLRDAKDDAKTIMNTVLAIKATLLDAEAKANHNHQVSFWLDKLKDVLYDADDLLDDLSTEALRREIMTRNKLAKKVRIFFSKSNQLIYNHQMGHKMREIRKRLVDMDDYKKILQLIDYPPKTLTANEERKQTYSFVQEGEIIRREEEKNLVLHYLLHTNVESSVSIIPIVGFGGLGKTALAQLVYNHVDVQKYFEFKKWVYVSDEFNVREIAQKILALGRKEEKEEVQEKLRTLIRDKRFLIVLDNVWNEDIELWRELKSLLNEGSKGSMIIVTTRSEKVGEIMGTHKPIILKSLDGDGSWELFCRMAFGDREELSDTGLVEIVRELVKKCAGVPLAIRTLGSLVRDKNKQGIDLSYLRDSELWKIDGEEERIFAMLKLSYNHLPSSMKACFAYCSLFPKDFSFKKQTVIQMWVAEGFIQSSDRCEEDVGLEYFQKLLSRSFFQEVERDWHDDIKIYKMNDLMHDLARSVAKNEYLVIREGNEVIRGDKTRYLSYETSCEGGHGKVPKSFVKAEKSRTMLMLEREIFFSYEMDSSEFHLVTSKLKCLRVLVLQTTLLVTIPESIGKLKHLRYFEVSRSDVYGLPRALTRLYNLQTLNLSHNFSFQQLPRDINKLVRLRHLILKNNVHLRWMPRRLGQLTSLQTLTHFAVADKTMPGTRDSAGISELGELNNLRELEIRGLRHLRASPEEAESAKLKEKPRLQRLSLSWDDLDRGNHDEDDLILERLHPHHSITSLAIKEFCGKRLPEWMGNLSSLQHLEFHYCKSLESLPDGLRNLRKLRTLIVKDCPILEGRCQKEDGDYWQKLAHIPTIIFTRDYRHPPYNRIFY